MSAFALLAVHCSLIDPFEGYSGGSPPDGGGGSGRHGSGGEARDGGGGETGGGGATSFEARCAGPGVIRCYGFDTKDDLAKYYKAPASGSRAEIDSTMKTSGAGALRFRIPASSTNGDLSGKFGVNFADDWSKSVGPGESVFIAWRQWFDATFLEGPWKGGGQRLATITLGDRIGASAGVISSPGVALDFKYNRVLPELSDTTGVPFQTDVPGEACVFVQNAVGCNSCQPYEPPLCLPYRANDWMTFQIAVTLGRSGAEDHVEAFLAYEGEASQKFLDVSVKLQDDGNKSLGKVWFFVSDTSFESGPPRETDTYIDELVISRAKVPDP